MNPIFGLESSVFILLIIVPILIFALGLTLIILNRGKRKNELASIYELSEIIAQFSARSMNNSLALEELIAERPDAPLEQALARLLAESELKYEKRWLPPLEHELRLELLPEYKKAAGRRVKVVGALLLLGILTSFALFLGVKSTEVASAAFWLPTAVSVFLSAFYLILEKDADQQSEFALEEFKAAVSRVFPVFNDRAGVALLVEDLLEHEKSIQESFNDFKESARYLADAEFSEGIQKSVKAVMSEEISPPIRDSARLLHELSDRLISEQESGMQKLAGEFSKAVAQELKTELSPIASELHHLAALIGDTREFIHDSVAVLESSRQENIKLNQELSESLRLMTVAKNDLANEMNEISANLEIISRTTEKMAAIYAGEEARLADRIKQLSASLNSAFNTLVEALESSGKSLELAATVRVDQHEQNRALVENLDALRAEMSQISDSLSQSSKDFTHESSEYVNQTLKNFDSGLAEVVERLIFTASAIRDAVDALPVALRPNKDL